MPDAMEILRDNVARLMTARDWSQHTLAAKSGVSQSAIGYVLRYRDQQDKRPGIEKIEQIARAFGLQAWQIMCPTNAQPEPEALDVELLRASIAGAIDAYRSKNMLIDDQRLAAAAAFLYRRVHEGVSMRAATNVVQQELSRFGANLAQHPNVSALGKETREPTAKGTVRRGTPGVGRNPGRKGVPTKTRG